MTSESDPTRKNDPTPNAEGESSKKTDHSENPIAPRSTPKSQCQPPHGHYEITRKAEKNWWDKAKPLVEFAGVILLAIYTGYTIKMYHANNKSAGAAKSAADTAQETLRVSQRAFVTIGRKDGVVAQFIIPPDPKMKVNLVLYFQNSGHLPAKLAWGTMGAYNLGQQTGITFTHLYRGMARSRDVRTGSIQEMGETATVAGDSVFVAKIGELAKRPFNEIPTVLISGMYEYCDGLGNDAKRTFAIQWEGGSGFNLTDDTAFPSMPLPKATSTTEFLPPCESLSETKQ